MMRVLYLAPAPPSPTAGGGSLRMFHMVKFLGSVVELDLVAPAGPGDGEAQRLCSPYCRELELVPPSAASRARRLLRVSPYEVDPAVAAAVRRRLASRGYDAVQVEKPAMLPYVPRHGGPPIVLDVWAYGLIGPLRAVRHERGLGTRLRNLLRLARFALFDSFRWPETACVLLVSEIDQARCARRRPRRRTLVVPNGVDCDAFRPRGTGRADAPRILFSGDMSFAPNIDAAVLLATAIFPEIRRRHPAAELRLAGRHPAPAIRRLAGDGITVTGAVPNMADELDQATLFVAPHFTGAGTRTKVLEAMAAELPIVTTPTGIEGIAAWHDEEVLLAADPRRLTEAACALLADPARRRRLGESARRLVQQRYDWPRCLAPLAELYRELPRRPQR